MESRGYTFQSFHVVFFGSLSPIESTGKKKLEEKSLPNLFVIQVLWLKKNVIPNDTQSVDSLNGRNPPSIRSHPICQERKSPIPRSCLRCEQHSFIEVLWSTFLDNLGKVLLNI